MKKTKSLNESSIKNAIQMMNRLKDAGIKNFYKVPEIVVAGIQSAGKSAVLERIIGIELLPSASGLCTRTPIEVRLINTEKEEYAKIFVIESENDESEKEIQVENLADIKKLIVEQTNLKAGVNKEIKDKPIIITVFSPKCPNLTLIDLPGVVNLPIPDSGQPENIKEITLNITKKYCEKPENLILCVLDSCSDINTNEILKFCKDLDAEGKRTMGVLTKCDRLNEGTSIKEALEGRLVKLQLGFFAVRNRTQKELEDGFNFDDTFEREKDYFSNHSVYKLMPEYWGIDKLIEKLSKIFGQLIKLAIPDILKGLNSRLTYLNGESEKLGIEIPEEFPAKRKILNSLVLDFCKFFEEKVLGRFNASVDKNFDFGGFQIVQNYESFLDSQNLQNFRISQTYTDDYIAESINKLYGDTFTGNVSTHAFIDLIQPLIENLRKPINEFIDCSEESLINIANECLKTIFCGYPSYSMILAQFVAEFIKQKVKDCKKHLSRNIDILKYPFTNNIEFQHIMDKYSYERSKNKIKSIANSNNNESSSTLPTQASELLSLASNSVGGIAGTIIENVVENVLDLNSEKLNSSIENEFKSFSLQMSEKVLEMRFRIDNYYRMIIISKLRDLVPGAVNTILLIESANEISKFLVDVLDDNPKIVESLREEDDVCMKRNFIKSEYKSISDLKKIIMMTNGNNI